MSELSLVRAHFHEDVLIVDMFDPILARTYFLAGVLIAIDSLHHRCQAVTVQ